MSESTSTTTDREIHDEYDVVVVGAGNAGLVSALAAKDAGAKVLVLRQRPRRSAAGTAAGWCPDRVHPHAGRNLRRRGHPAPRATAES